MRAELIDGASAVTKYWPIVFVLGIGNVLMNSILARYVFTPEMAVPVLVAVAYLSIVAHGKVAGYLRRGDSPTSAEILRMHGVNYLVVVVALGLPGFAVRVLLGATLTRSAYLVTTMGLRVAIGVVTLYALPLVFRRRQSLRVIGPACRFLLRRRAASAPLVALVAAVNGGMATGSVVLRSAEGSLLVAVSTILLVLGTFGSLLVFAAAFALVLSDRSPDSTATA